MGTTTSGTYHTSLRSPDLATPFKMSKLPHILKKQCKQCRRITPSPSSIFSNKFVLELKFCLGYNLANDYFQQSRQIWTNLYGYDFSGTTYYLCTYIHVHIYSLDILLIYVTLHPYRLYFPVEYFLLFHK